MARKRYVDSEYPTKVEAQQAGQRAVGLTYVQKIQSMVKRYEVKKVGKNWRLHLIEKTAHEFHGGKLR
jgi:hypothetical protein